MGIKVPRSARGFLPTVERPEAICQINVAALAGVTGSTFGSCTSKRYKGLNFC